MTEPSVPRLIAKEGLHVLHLFYSVDHGQWQLFSKEEQFAAKTALAALVQEIRATDQTQLLMFSMISPKADFGILLMTPDLHQANAFEKRLTLALGVDVLNPVFSFFSVTEQSEYVSSDLDYEQTLLGEKELGSHDYAVDLIKYRARAEQYRREKFNPTLPNWPLFCFYPVSRRRGETNNWYLLKFAERKLMMAQYMRISGQWKGRVNQIITGASGLDSMEWGVSLFAHDSSELKSAAYELRFDRVGAEFTDFGELFVGLQLPLNEIYARLQL